jgi:glucose-1-phosphate adenylyltransferase
VVVEKGAVVRDSVLMEDCVVRAGAEVHTAVVDERCEILAGARLGARPTARLARDEDIVLVGRDSRVGGDVAAGSRLEPGTDTGG